MRKTFIRFGEIPEDGKSPIYGGNGNVIGKELGVSCYDFTNRGGFHRIVTPSANAEFALDLNSALVSLEKDEIPCYFITAEQVGIGVYGEPVVRHIEILHELEVKEFHNLVSVSAYGGGVKHLIKKKPIEIKGVEIKEYFDKKGEKLKNGDIINLHQTVNGQNLFLAIDTFPLDIRYAHDTGRIYEYDKDDMLKPSDLNGEVGWEIVGNVGNFV